jgi:hypothetical protein
MKSDICAFVLPALAAASKRPMVTTEPHRNRLRFRFKTPHLFLLLGLKFVFAFYTLQAL